MERSVYIIKPEAMSERGKISHLIEASGLRIAARKLTKFPREALDVFYPELSQDLREATAYYFGLGLSEIGIVEGPGAIARLFQLAGKSVDPAECGPSTIRFQFGSRSPVRMGNVLYYRNGFHRARNASDAAREMAIYQTLPDLSGTTESESPTVDAHLFKNKSNASLG